MITKGVFFDFYGTLCVLGDMTAELNEWIPEFFIRLKRCGLTATKEDVWNYYHQRMQRENPPKPENGMTIFERRIQIAGSDFGLNMTRSKIEEIAEARLAVWDKYTSVDSASIPILASLKKLGKVTALISNFDHPRHVHKLVRDTGMSEYFAAVIISGDYGVKKPDPLLFQMALTRTGLESGETVYVGDSEEDIIGANNAGMISVLIDRNSHKRDYGQQHTISKLQDVLMLIAEK